MWDPRIGTKGVIKDTSSKALPLGVTRHTRFLKILVEPKAWDFGWDPRPKTLSRGETRDPTPLKFKWDLRHETLNVILYGAKIESLILNKLFLSSCYICVEIKVLLSVRCMFSFTVY